MKIDDSILNKSETYYGVIYLYENLINHKKYVGQTTKPILERHKNHKYQKYNSYFHNALTKYGEDNFQLTIIDCAYSADELNAKEEYWIKFYNSVAEGYNLTFGGKGSSGYKHTKETIEHLKQINLGANNPMYGKSLSDEQRKKYSLSHKGIGKGKRLSESTKEKIRKSKLGKTSGRNNPMFGKHHTEKSKEKIRNNRKSFKGSNHPQSKIFVQLNQNGEFIAEYPSGLDASLATGCDRSDITKCCKGKIKQSKGYIWKYKEDYIKVVK